MKGPRPNDAPPNGSRREATEPGLRAGRTDGASSVGTLINGGPASPCGGSRRSWRRWSRIQLAVAALAVRARLRGACVAGLIGLPN